LKLLELSNFNHPLLHELNDEGPGTYHHSVIAGSLAEIAADRVKANPLLARVAAYYHDIGKMTKPLYFIENQPPNHNPHDALTPSISAKILFAHVKIGVRMAEEHNLGDDITGIIEQHHGTTLISYFFNRAKDNCKDGHEHAHEGDFRYPGPETADTRSRHRDVGRLLRSRHSQYRRPHTRQDSEHGPKHHQQSLLGTAVWRLRFNVE
jgi:putative nucleotidyltransferase with HDIG domain